MTRGNTLKQTLRFEEAPSTDPNAIPPQNDGGQGSEGDGKGGKPTDREAELLREVMRRKENEKQLKNQLDSLQGELAKFEGIDVEQVKALLREKQERETAEAEARGDFERVKQQMIAAHTEELNSVRSSLEAQVQELTSQLQNASGAITELTIGRAFSDSSFVRDSLTLTPAKARVVFGSHFELKDGAVVAYDKPAGAANRTLLVDGAGAPLPFDKAIEKIVSMDSDADHLIRAKIKGGAGSKSDTDQKAKPQVSGGRDRISAAIAAGGLTLRK